MQSSNTDLIQNATDCILERLRTLWARAREVQPDNALPQTLADWTQLTNYLGVTLVEVDAGLEFTGLLACHMRHGWRIALNRSISPTRQQRALVHELSEYILATDERDFPPCHFATLELRRHLVSAQVENQTTPKLTEN